MKHLFKTIKQQVTQKFSGGLINEKPDGSEFSLQQFGGRSLGKAPKEEFEVPRRPAVKDQANTDFCIAFQSMYTVEQDTGEDLSPAFVFAAAKKKYYRGNYYGFGLSIKSGLGTLQKYGICLDSLYPFSSSLTRNRMANHNNISKEAWEDAKTRKMKEGYFEVDVFPDKFDSFLAGMYHWQEPVITGINWYSGFYTDSKGRLVTRKTGNNTGHCIGAWKSVIVEGEQRIEFQNSYNYLPKFSLNREQCKDLYFGYIVLPIERPIVEIIRKYAGKVIRAKSGRPPIYLVVDGKKRHFKTENALNLTARRLDTFIEVDDDELNIIPTGEPINLEDLDEWAKALVIRNSLKI